MDWGLPPLRSMLNHVLCSGADGKLVIFTNTDKAPWDYGVSFLSLCFVPLLKFHYMFSMPVLPCELCLFWRKDGESLRAFSQHNICWVAFEPYNRLQKSTRCLPLEHDHNA